MHQNYNTSNNKDLVEQCRLFMVEKGLELSQSMIIDGNIHRYSASAKRNKLDEWYVAYEGISDHGNQYLVCTFGSWKTDEKYVFKSWDAEETFNTEERNEFAKIYKAKIEATEKALKVKHDEVAQEAQKIWDESFSELPTEEYSRYFKKKGIDPIGVKYGLNPNAFPSVIIPFYNIETYIRTLQFISVDDSGKVYKSFLAGGEKKGCFATVRDDSLGNSKTIFVCEGYATGVSVYMSQQNLKHPVIVAGDAGNLTPVLENLRKSFRNNTIIIAADNDEKGRSKAREAANKYNCKVIYPEFLQEQSEDSNGKKYSDFNDLHCVAGLKEVNRQLNISREKTTRNETQDHDDVCVDFSLDDYPSIISEYVSSICLTTNADPIMVLASSLSMVSAFMGKKIFIEHYFQTLYPNLWILIVAKSGQFKSTALSKGATIALRKSKNITKEIKKLQKELRNDQNKATEINEIIENLFLKNPILPAKITAEALLNILSEGRSGLILSNEFSAWLQNLEKKYNNDLKGIFTDFYDCNGSFEYATKTHGTIVVEDPFISICGVSPLVGIASNLNLNDVASGFLARFLIITPAHQNNIPPALPDRNVFLDTEAEKKLETILEPLFDMTENSRIYVLSESARLLFEKYHEDMYKNLNQYDEKCREILEPFIKRWSPYILKIAMIMQFLEDNLTNEISETAIASAYAFVSIVERSTIKLFQGELGESEYQRKCRKLYDFIKKKHKETNIPVLRQIIFASKKLNGRNKEYDSVLDTLIEQGAIDVDKNGKGKTEWGYIPKNY
jgi:phage/plasmid primase-like uncharacterized protein